MYDRCEQLFPTSLSVPIQEQKKNGQNLPESDTLITQEDARKRLQQNNVDETDHA